MRSMNPQFLLSSFLLCFAAGKRVGTPELQKVAAHMKKKGIKGDLLESAGHDENVKASATFKAEMGGGCKKGNRGIEKGELFQRG